MFPNHFPSQAVDTIMKMVLGTDKSSDKIALALYELVGYVLFQVFGDAKYLVSAMIQDDIKETLLVSSGFTLNIRDKIRQRFNELRSGNVAFIFIILQLLIEYGPMVRKLIEELRKLFNEKPNN